ncbi:unnamed protein product [Ectocarpus sp. CCAP 1310/34]|nr:unnamed protein product [Ectocarpus sp. CCAP 1310/34]
MVAQLTEIAGLLKNFRPEPGQDGSRGPGESGDLGLVPVQSPWGGGAGGGASAPASYVFPDEYQRVALPRLPNEDFKLWITAIITWMYSFTKMYYPPDAFDGHTLPPVPEYPNIFNFCELRVNLSRLVLSDGGSLPGTGESRGGRGKRLSTSSAETRQVPEVAVVGAGVVVEGGARRLVVRGMASPVDEDRLTVATVSARRRPWWCGVAATRGAGSASWRGQLLCRLQLRGRNSSQVIGRGRPGPWLSWGSEASAARACPEWLPTWNQIVELGPKERELCSTVLASSSSGTHLRHRLNELTWDFLERG